MKKLIRFFWSLLVVRGRSAKFYYRASRGLRVKLNAPASPMLKKVLNTYLEQTDPGLWAGKVDAGSYLNIKSAVAADGFSIWVNGKRLKNGQ